MNIKQVVVGAVVLAGASLGFAQAFAQAPEYHVYRNTTTCQGSVAKTTPAAGWIQIWGPCAFGGCFDWIVKNCEGGPDPKVPHFCQRNLCPR
jgi:hypothetical protein